MAGPSGSVRTGASGRGGSKAATRRTDSYLATFVTPTIRCAALISPTTAEQVTSLDVLRHYRREHMSEAYTGGCACGAIRYEISAEPLVMNDCQCRDCQRKSGTGHGSYLTFPRARA